MPIRETAPVRPLFLNLRAVAIARGIPTVTALAARLQRPRQNLYGLWRGSAKQLTPEYLTILCGPLGLNPGEWFRWEEREVEVEENGKKTMKRALVVVWNYQHAATRRGLNRNQALFATSTWPRTFNPIWDGTSKGAFIDTLARLASALDGLPAVEGPEVGQPQPFDIGDLFTWDRPADADSAGTVGIRPRVARPAETEEELVEP